ncbi:toll-like receptor 4 [Saccostrea echinata]|uniref:toll-like receptor 4 n=1 Tax=Saccostrea echinata TaxID=191078 RepID=UPI002A7F15A3|nr:toll-like receptor 4 [Saccostrea echinata]
MDTPVLLLLVYSIASVFVNSLYNRNCSSGQICVCFKVNGYIHADCSARHLRSAPTLNSDVVSVDFGHNRFYTYPTNLSPSIRFLNLTRNRISIIMKKAFIMTPFLQNLTLSDNEIKSVEKGAFGYLKKLQHLDLSYNEELAISVLPNVSYDLESTSIKVLNLEKLQCTYGISTSLHRRHVQYLRNTSLLELNIASNRLNYLEFGLLLDLPKTLRILNIGDNVLSFGWYLTNFGGLSNLEILNVSFESTFHLIAPHQFTFRCNDTKASDTTGLVVTVITSRIVHRYRWRLRYLFYVAKGNKRRNQKQQVAHPHKYYFDAFISYAEEDGIFVRDLVKYLENEHKLRLCIHQRDFIPGTDIADNIANAIHNSQRTVCLLTSDYLESYWCNYEMNMARMEAIYDRNRSNVLFFIICQKGITKKLPLKWMDLIHSKSYLEFFGENKNEITAFRSKLAETLQETLYEEEF